LFLTGGGLNVTHLLAKLKCEFFISLVWFKELSQRKLPKKRLSQQNFSSALGHAHPLGWLVLFWRDFFGFSSSDLDFWFGLFNEPQEFSIVFQLAALVNQTLTVSELDPSARVPKPTHPRDSLQSFSYARKLLSNN
jgi:hypothetical protein